MGGVKLFETGLLSDNVEAKAQLEDLKYHTLKLLQISEQSFPHLSPKEYNKRMHHVERTFRIEEGVIGRKFFKSLLQASGLYLGYGAEVFPSLTQAVREKDQG